MASEEKILQVGEAQETPQAITITIVDPSALGSTSLDPSLVAQGGADQGSIVMVSGAEDSKAILQTVTETHMGTEELPIISNISNPEEEEMIVHETKLSESFDGGGEEGELGDSYEDVEEPSGPHCLVCNIDLTTNDSDEQVPVFKTQTSTTQRKVAVFLSSLIGQKVTSRKAHSDILCRRCFSLLDRVDSLEVEIRETKEEIINKYQETVSVYGGRARRIKPATAKKPDYVFPKVEPEDEADQLLDMELDGNFEPQVEDLMDEDPSLQDDDWEPKFKRPRIKKESTSIGVCESSDPPKRKRGRPRKDLTKAKESVGVTIGQATNIPAQELSQKSPGTSGAITVFCMPKRSTSRRRPPASYRPCDVCGLILFGGVDRHVASHHPEILVRPCALCDARFRTFRQLGSHVLRTHGPVLQCPVCAVGYLHAVEFQKHVQEAHSEAPATYTCVVCRSCMSSLSDYCSHMESHEEEAAVCAQGKVHKENSNEASDKDDGGLLECGQCQEKFKYPSARRRHLQESHGEQLNFRCEICHLLFSSSGGLLDHTETHSTGKINCPLCDQHFARFHHLKNHCNVVHANTASYRCQHCTHVGKSINAIFTHSVIHHPGQLGLARNVACSKCGEKFHSGRELSQHKAARHPEIVDCLHCGKKFSKSQISSHINEKHTKQHKLECSYCHQTFYNSSRLSDHVKRHHLREKYSRYVCPECSKAYITRHELERHMAAHQNERRHKCEFCSRAYFKAGDLTYHRRTHTGERPHCCFICAAAFSRPSELSTHMSRVHGIHNWSRRYLRSAGSAAGAPLEGGARDKATATDGEGQVVVEGKQDPQLITEVGEDGHVVQVVEENSPLQVVQALPQDDPHPSQSSDMQVIYVELAE
ncbi:zinc finger protein 184-like isoform X7 [Portunus trituberculatus]|uniref:zinc finger protein 184-like isoform X7 n=1 Tax=Portunus trituberculatus TaxID=210409 RepID=UPI001E1CB90A|nr:zinc finger protein 184-like isoform X7 [Portunus trituberculatus]